MKFRLLYFSVLIFAALTLILSVLIRRQSNNLKESINYKAEKLQSLSDTVKELNMQIEAKKVKVDRLRTEIEKKVEEQKQIGQNQASNGFKSSKSFTIQTVPIKEVTSCRCDPGLSTKIAPGKYVASKGASIVYEGDNTCHPKPFDISIDLNFIDSTKIGTDNIQMILSNNDAALTGGCIKTTTPRMRFQVARYAVHCNASLVGQSSNLRLPVKQILLDLKPQSALRYNVKLVVNIDCDIITGIIQVYLGNEMTNSARVAMSYVGPQ